MLRTTISTVTNPARNSAAGRVLMRGAGVVAIGLCLTACTVPDEATRAQVYLPQDTERLSAGVERDKQLATGNHKDDFPEFTGAPGPRGELPAYVPAKGKTVFAGWLATDVQGEQTATAAEVRSATVDRFDRTVSDIEIAEQAGAPAYVVLEGQQ